MPVILAPVEEMGGRERLFLNASLTEENLHEACRIMGGRRDRIIPHRGIQRRGSKQRSRQENAHLFPGHLERAVYICRCRNAAPPAFGVTAPTLAADAGFETFNGDGTGTDIVTLRVNGVIQFHNFVASTRYTLNPNCTGTITVSVNGGPGPTFDIFVAPDGEAFSSIATDPGNYPSRIERRVNE